VTPVHAPAAVAVVVSIFPCDVLIPPTLDTVEGVDEDAVTLLLLHTALTAFTKGPPLVLVSAVEATAAVAAGVNACMVAVLMSTLLPQGADRSDATADISGTAVTEPVTLEEDEEDALPTGRLNAGDEDARPRTEVIDGTAVELLEVMAAVVVAVVVVIVE
jgi:hypothetical protein